MQYKLKSIKRMMYIGNIHYFFLKKQIFTVDLQEHRELYEMHSRSNPNEVLLGAFVTGNLNLDIGVAYLSTEYSKKENYFLSSAVLSSPVILKFNPTL